MTVAIMIVYFSYLFALASNPYSHRNHMIFMFSLPRKYYSEKYWKLSCSFCFCSNDNTFLSEHSCIVSLTVLENLLNPMN